MHCLIQVHVYFRLKTHREENKDVCKNRNILRFIRLLLGSWMWRRRNKERWLFFSCPLLIEDARKSLNWLQEEHRCVTLPVDCFPFYWKINVGIDFFVPYFVTSSQDLWSNLGSMLTSLSRTFPLCCSSWKCRLKQTTSRWQRLSYSTHDSPVSIRLE